MDHEGFFEFYGPYQIDRFVERTSHTVEDLYQAIKARLVAELAAEVGTLGVDEVRWPLVDTTKEDK
jgi:hypothetical protein